MSGSSLSLQPSLCRGEDLAKSISTSPLVAHTKDADGLTPSQGQIQSQHRAMICRYADMSPVISHPQGTPTAGVAVRVTSPREAEAPRGLVAMSLGDVSKGGYSQAVP